MTAVVISNFTVKNEAINNKLLWQLSFFTCGHKTWTTPDGLSSDASQITSRLISTVFPTDIFWTYCIGLITLNQNLPAF